MANQKAQRRIKRIKKERQQLRALLSHMQANSQDLLGRLMALQNVVGILQKHLGQDKFQEIVMEGLREQAEGSIKADSGEPAQNQPVDSPTREDSNGKTEA